MATKSTIRTAVQQNLDDTSADKWTTARLDLILARSRRWVFSQSVGAEPGRRLIEARTITATAGTREYALEDDEKVVESLERIAINGSTLDDPVKYDLIEYEDRRKYADAADAGAARGYYYVYEGTQASGAGKALRMLGIIPTPGYSTADFKVYCFRRPDFSWDTAGSGTEDAYESGLTAEWEDVLIVHATIAALRQRPPRDSKTMDGWKDALTEALDAALKGDRAPARKRRVRTVGDWPG